MTQTIKLVNRTELLRLFYETYPLSNQLLSREEVANFIRSFPFFEIGEDDER